MTIQVGLGRVDGIKIPLKAEQGRVSQSPCLMQVSENRRLLRRQFGSACPQATGV